MTGRRVVPVNDEDTELSLMQTESARLHGTGSTNEEFTGRRETELGQEVRGAIERLPVSNIRFRRSQKQGLIPAGLWEIGSGYRHLARPS